MGTGIEWTDETWNPIVGCDIVSPGCTNCYAMKMAARIEAMQPSSHYAGTTKRVNGNAVWTGKLAQASEDTLTQPMRWKTLKKIFVNSMGDLFHEDVPNEWIDNVFAVMALCPQHTFQILTKRAKRMREYCNKSIRSHLIGRAISAMIMERILDNKITDDNFPWPDDGDESGEDGMDLFKRFFRNGPGGAGKASCAKIDRRYSRMQENINAV